MLTVRVFPPLLGYEEGKDLSKKKENSRL